MVQAISTGQSVLYVFILILSMLFFFVSLYFGFKIKGEKYKKDDEEKIIGVNDLRRLKPILFFVSYLMFYFTATILFELCEKYLEVEGLINIFKWLYLSMTAIIGPLFIATVWIVAINKLNDKKTQRALERGIDVER